MKNIFLAGAGRSSNALIRFLLQEIDTYEWKLIVGDARRDIAAEKIGDHARAKAVEIDVRNEEQMASYISEADMVISLIPPALHIEVARICLRLETHLVTASYLSGELEELGEEVRSKGLIFMTELGLDPGIDHMSAVKTLDELRGWNADIHSFRSYAGGLIAPECDDNPWHYKFTWNPRNVVLAGQGTAQYYEQHSRKYIPYHRLFSNHSEVHIQDMGTYEMYPNRDALRYRSMYGIKDIPTILRGTLRNVGFCDAWHALIYLGLTDDSFTIHQANDMTYRDWVEAFVPGDETLDLEDRTAHLLDVEEDSQIMHQLEWIGLFEEEPIGMKYGTPAEILQNLLMDKWRLRPGDKDMIIMQHEFEYELHSKKYMRRSTMVMKGTSAEDTAMSRLVGYPLGIFTSLVLRGEIYPTGLNIPVLPEVYEAVLEELAPYGVIFREKVEEIKD